MRAWVYNLALVVGVGMISVGAGMVYLPAGLITAGVIVLALTLAGARIAGRVA